MSLDPYYLRQLSFAYEYFQNHSTTEGQLFKVGEEWGEVCEAWVLRNKWNPRKLSHVVTTADVVGELADVAMTAMLAMMFLGYDPDDQMAKQMRKIMERIELDTSIS